MSAHKQRQGLVMSALVIAILAITTFIVTELKASQLKSFLGMFNNDVSDISSRKSIQLISDYDSRGRGNDNGVVFRGRGNSTKLSEGANASAGWIKDTVDGHDQINHNDDKIIRVNQKPNLNQSTSISEDEASDDESDDDEVDDNVGELDDDEMDENDDDEIDGNINDEHRGIRKIEDDPILSKLSPQLKEILSNNTKHINNKAVTASPACHPHFHLSLPNNRWNNTTKFRRIYFYHARKAGGSSMHKYLAKVSAHYGLELKAVEWSAMEEPGTNADNATFYVSHLREPVDRSISHFRYQGRWDCKDLTFKRKSWTPTEDNANKLETWNQTGGHVPFECRTRGKKTTGKHPVFHLGSCALNCYTQWFSGLSCPAWGIPVTQQYQVAKAKLLKFNLVVVIEKLRDPNYVQAVEDFFGVSGITEKGNPFCEKQSHKANAKNPLIVRNDTRERLTRLNQVDMKFYREMTDCLDSGRYHFPKWDPNRFDLNSTDFWAAKAAKMRYIEAKRKQKRAKAGKNHG